MRFGLLQNAICRSLTCVRLFTTWLSQNAQPNVDYAVSAVGALPSSNCKSFFVNYLQEENRTGAF
jgi:hypothetical protein